MVSHLGLNNFNPRSPCGERPLRILADMVPAVIFQSTLPVWGATTSTLRRYSVYCYFNPRSPCGERPTWSARPITSKLFQSTLPVWGATLICPRLNKPHKKFQSTLPVWGATIYISYPLRYCGISIHAPRVGSDIFCVGKRFVLFDFNPRSPCGERRIIK